MSAPLSRSRLLRRALLGSGALVVAAVGLLAASAGEPVVEILADDVRHEVQLSDGTVADALAVADVGFGPNDLVTPGPDTVVDQDVQVVVTRAITVDIVIDDGTPITVTAPVASVGGALSAADLRHLGLGGAVISPTWRAPLRDGDTITVLTADDVQERIRLWGIDSPEQRGGQPFWRASRDQLAEQVAGKTVTVTWDSRDRFGRIVGWVITPDGIWVNKVMVLRNGVVV